MFSIAPTRASASTATIAGQINAIANLSATYDATTVTVSGTNEHIATPLLLTIDAGITVNWDAIYTGAVSPASTSMITINGSGTLNVNGTISNSGTGNTLNITGTGTTVNLSTAGTGGTVQSSRSGSALLISADDTIVNVGENGAIISLDGNVNAAVQIGGGATILGTKINVNGGAIASIGSGFAINDGAGTALFDNNTEIRISSGVVTAGGNSAIHSTGIYSTVVISGGVISNAAGNNLNPAIDMVGDLNGSPAFNITVSGTAVVQSASINGYALQTKGNVIVQDNAYISAINGRAINLVGLNSIARVVSGKVETSGNGIAISTATTNVETVTGASVEILGGEVTSVNGNAINITGANSKVTVSGGIISSMSSANHTINASGANATISISGSAEVSAVGGDAIRTTATIPAAVSISGSAKVSSINARAIQANGEGAGVTISGTTQVYVLNAGNAIRCTNGTVTLNSGFIFAYGTNGENVINAPRPIILPPSSPAFVIAWNKDRGSRLYPLGNSASQNTDLDVRVSGYNSNFWWYNHPTLGGGINYSFSPNTGFFQIPEVSVYGDHGLIFVSATGIMYRNNNNNITLNSSNIPDYPNGYEYYSYRDGHPFASPPYRWGVNPPASPGDPYELKLYGFSWTTNTSSYAAYQGTALDALTIIGDTNIIVTGDSTFEAANPGAVGIRFLNGSEDVTISGTNTLRAASGNVSPGLGLNIGGGHITLAGGTFIAQGNQAINWTGSETDRITRASAVFDYNWSFSQSYDGSGGTAGYYSEDPFQLYTTDKFVMFRPVRPVNLINAVQLGGISHIADSVAIELTFSGPVSGLTVDDITILNNGTVGAAKGVLNGSGTTWTLTLNSVDVEGLVGISVNQHVEEYFIDDYEILNIDIFKADKEEYHIILTKIVEYGGDFDQLFEFEIFHADDPRSGSVPLVANPDDAYPVYVTFRDGSPIPARRIAGASNNVLLLRHDETVMIHELPIGEYYVQEHANQGLITAFNVDSTEWFTAPDGTSRPFMLTADVILYCFNSIIPETPGEPSRLFYPNFAGATAYNTENIEKSPQTGVYRDYSFSITLFILALISFAAAEVYRRKYISKMSR